MSNFNKVLDDLKSGRPLFEPLGPDLNRLNKGSASNSKRIAVPYGQRDAHWVPQREPSAIPGGEGDRFIPVYDEKHMATAKIMQNPVAREQLTQLCDPNNKDYAYQQAIAKAAGIVLPDKDFRINTFKNKKFSAAQLEKMSAMHTLPQTTQLSKQSKRHISTAAVKIMDAPAARNDFYLNLLDWSIKDILAVPLDDTLFLWNAQTSSIKSLFNLVEDDDDQSTDYLHITSVRWADAGNVIAVGLSTGEIHIWDVEKEKLVRKYSMPGSSAGLRIPVLAWNVHLLTAGSRSGKVHCFDIRSTVSEVARLDGHTQEVCGLEWSPNGQFLASGGNDNMVYIWESSRLGLPASMPASRVPEQLIHKPSYGLCEHMAAVKGLAWCPWRTNLLATGSGSLGPAIRLFDISHSKANSNSVHGAAEMKINSHHALSVDSQVSGLKWNSDFKELLSAHGSPSNAVVVRRYPDLNALTTIKGHEGRIISCTLSSSGEYVATLGGDETVRIWDVFKVDESVKRQIRAHRRDDKLGMDPITRIFLSDR